MTSSPPRRGLPGLSPSRANDFLQCPLLFRYRVIDKLTEPPSSAAVRGTLVHGVLERLFDAPAGERTLEVAREMLGPEWDTMLAASPELSGLFVDEAEVLPWLTSAGELLGTYFTLEDPTRLEPRERELFVESQLEDGPLLRGIVDRLDVAPNGAMRVVDYKTGRSPRAGYEDKALFQLKFYGLVLWRSLGEIPQMLQLVYLGDGQVLRHVPTQSELEVTELKARSIWTSIETAARTSTWEPRTSRLCDWCSHQARCPAFGGTPPELDPDSVELAIGVRPV